MIYTTHTSHPSKKQEAILNTKNVDAIFKELGLIERKPGETHDPMSHLYDDDLNDLHTYEQINALNPYPNVISFKHTRNYWTAGFQIWLTIDGKRKNKHFSFSFLTLNEAVHFYQNVKNGTINPETHSQPKLYENYIPVHAVSYNNKTKSWSVHFDLKNKQHTVKNFTSQLSAEEFYLKNIHHQRKAPAQ